MAEKTYSLYTDAEILDQRLAVEIGDDYVVLVAGADGRISGLEYFSTEDGLDETMEDISHNSSLIKKNYSETKLFYNLPETVLVPVGQFNSAVASEFVDLAFGPKASSRVNVENINIAPGIVNVYRSNENWQDVISRHFRVVIKRHVYSKLVEEAIERHFQLRVIFYKKSFTIIALKDDHLKIARSFSFENDADAVYHILNTCKQVDIVAAEVPVNVSGFIETDGSMVRLLAKYFGIVVIENVLQLTLPPGQQDKYPSHYFTSFINLLA